MRLCKSGAVKTLLQAPRGPTIGSRPTLRIVVVLSLICEGDLVFDSSVRGPLFCVLYRRRRLIVVVGRSVAPPPKPPPIPRSAPNITALLRIDSAYSIALLEAL